MRKIIQDTKYGKYLRNKRVNEIRIKWKNRKIEIITNEIRNSVKWDIQKRYGEE